MGQCGWSPTDEPSSWAMKVTKYSSWKLDLANEVEVHTDNLSDQAISLGKKLKELNDQKKKKAKAFALSRSKMKVPKVTANDLDKDAGPYEYRRSFHISNFLGGR